MGLGLQNAMGVEGGFEALDQILAKRMLAKKLEDDQVKQQQAQQQQAIENEQRNRQLGQTDTQLGQSGRRLDLESQPVPEKPIVINGSLVDPTTGRVITSIPSQAAPAAQRLITGVGPGGKPTRMADEPGASVYQAPVNVPQGRESLSEFEAKEKIKAQYSGAKPSIGAEKTALAFYNRAKQASDEIQKIEPQIAGKSLAGQARLQYAPNFMQSDTNQSYRQSQRAFTEARLRKESGAAIPEQEYQNDAQTYFAQPGDTPATLAQKRKGRQDVLDGLKFQSGRAYDEFYGAQQDAAPQQPTAQRKPIPGIPGGEAELQNGKWIRVK